MSISTTFKRSRMCKEEAQLWAEAYMIRLIQNPTTFDTDYNIINSYPIEVICILAKISPQFREKLSTQK